MHGTEAVAAKRLHLIHHHEALCVCVSERETEGGGNSKEVTPPNPSLIVLIALPTTQMYSQPYRGHSHSNVHIDL